MNKKEIIAELQWLNIPHDPKQHHMTLLKLLKEEKPKAEARAVADAQKADTPKVVKQITIPEPVRELVGNKQQQKIDAKTNAQKELQKPIDYFTAEYIKMKSVNPHLANKFFNIAKTCKQWHKILRP